MINQNQASASPDFNVPERPHLRIGFVRLTDCASLVAAKMMDFGRKHGLNLELCRQPSWAAVRDKLLSGELDAAHSLYGLVYGVQLGLGGPQADMAILMTLNRNGQAITVSNRLGDALDNGLPLQAALATLGRKPVFAQTFPTGTHAMWLNYWLAAQNVHPLRDIESLVIPPPQMVEALAQGELDGFCAGEPWPAMAEAKHVGRTIACTSEVWPNHPEKALACRREFAALYPNTARALIRTVLEAGKWLENPLNRVSASEWLARPEYVGVPRELIETRLLGGYGGSGTPLPIRFFDDAAMNYPQPTDGLWFLSQYYRWGMLRTTANWESIAVAVSQTEHFRAAAKSLGYRAAPTLSASCELMDGRSWHGRDAVEYANSFAIRV